MRTAFTLAALAAVASSFAGTYTVSNSSTVMMSGTAATNVNVTLNGATGTVRGFGVSGDWSVVTNATQWSQEFGATLASGGSTSMGRTAFGGTSTGAAMTFSPTASSPWVNAGGAYDALGLNSSNGSYTIGFNQSYGATGLTQFNMTGATFYTDYAAPTSTTINDASGTFARPTSLTALSTASTYKYSATSFTIGTAGTYLLAGGFTGLSTSTTGGLWDGYLYIYKGAFDPNNPLNNLMSMDDDGAALNGSSSMLSALSTGTYTAVLSEYSATGIGAGASANATFYLAGGITPVPEPGTWAALGLGAVVLLRRRKRA